MTDARQSGDQRSAQLNFVAGRLEAGRDCKRRQSESVAYPQFSCLEDGDSERVAKKFVVVGIEWLWIYAEFAARDVVSFLENGELRRIVTVGRAAGARHRVTFGPSDAFARNYLERSGKGGPPKSTAIRRNIGGRRGLDCTLFGQATPVALGRCAGSRV
jgi:hypothetical protein